MRTLTLTSFAALVLLLSACSGSESPKAAPAAAPAAASASTSLSINAKDGAVSYESDNGKNSTSISVGGDATEKKEKKPE